MNEYAQLLSQLDDGQLMDLLKLILQEGSSRNLEREFQEIAADEKEMANITRAAYEQEFKRQINIQKDVATTNAKQQAAAAAAAKFGSTTQEPEDKTQHIWRCRKAIEFALTKIGLTNQQYTWSLTVWDRSDKRIYLNDANNRAVATYWHTGTNKQPPQSISCTSDLKDHFVDKTISAGQKKQLKQLFIAIANGWQSLSIDSETIESFDVEPDPIYLAKYLKAIDGVS
jgi:hypothetical protein